MPLSTALFVIIPLLVLNVGLYMLTRDWVLESKREQLETLSNIVSNQMTELMETEWHGLVDKAGELVGLWKPGTVGTDSLTMQARRVLDKDGQDHGQYVLLDSLGSVLVNPLVQLDPKGLLNSHEMERLRSGQRVITGLIRDTSGLAEMVLWCVPLMNERKDLLGILGRTMEVSSLQTYTRNIRIGGTGYGYLADRSGHILSHPDPSRVGTLTENMILREYLDKSDEQIIQNAKVSIYEYRGSAKYMAFSLMPESRWFFVLNQTLDEIEIPVFRVLLISIGAFVIMVFAGIFLALRLSESITRPIDNMVEVVSAIAQGDFSRQCLIRGDDELSRLSSHLNNMSIQLVESRKRLSDSQRALQISEDRYRCAVEGAQDVIYDWDFLRQKLFVSDKFLETFGMEFKHTGDFMDFFRRYALGEDYLILENEFDELMKRSRSVLRLELRFREGSDLVWMLLRGKIQWGPLGEAVRMSGSMTNITDRKRKEERIHHLAFFDSLTGLPNRQACIEQAPRILHTIERDSFISGVALLDVDDLRKVNDSLGHEAGDQILSVVGERLSFFSQAHPGYNGKPGTLYRFGGDEFILLLPAFSSEEELNLYMESIACRVSSAYSIGEKLMYVNLSIGVSLFPRDGKEILDLLRKADTALNAAKSNSQDHYTYYSQEMTQGLSWRLEIEESLRLALQQNRFEVYYQPLVNLQNHKLIGFECLIRMPPGPNTSAGPQEFIPIAEKTGLIHEMGTFVFVTACRQIRDWKDQKYDLEYVSVNVSPVQFLDPEFVSILVDSCRQEACEPSWIQIEITESVLFESFATVVPALNALKQAGFRIALDDFGIGYSSLGYLKAIPLHCIKIDKSFVQDMALGSPNLSIAKGILQIAEGMGLTVIAEGIEDPDQARFLEALGCQIGQGYHYGRPVPSHDLTTLLDTVKGS